MFELNNISIIIDFDFNLKNYKNENYDNSILIFRFL